MGGKRLPVCRHCGRKFRPDSYNQHRQQWCSRSECRRARDRERKRKYYRRRLAEEAGFRESERTRCRDGMRHCRSRQAEPVAAESALLVRGPPPTELLVGLIAQLADTSDPQVVGEVMHRYAERGRRVAVARPIRGSPVR